MIKKTIRIIVAILGVLLIGIGLIAIVVTPLSNKEVSYYVQVQFVTFMAILTYRDFFFKTDKSDTEESALDKVSDS